MIIYLCATIAFALKIFRIFMLSYFNFLLGLLGLYMDSSIACKDLTKVIHAGPVQLRGSHRAGQFWAGTCFLLFVLGRIQVAHLRQLCYLELSTGGVDLSLLKMATLESGWIEFVSASCWVSGTTQLVILTPTRIPFILTITTLIMHHIIRLRIHHIASILDQILLLSTIHTVGF